MKFEALSDKKDAKKLKPGDHIMVGDMLWRVVEGTRSMGTPTYMLKLAYYTHTDPQSYKFHPVRPEEPFLVFQQID